MIPQTWITEFLKELKVLKQIVKLIMIVHVKKNCQRTIPR